MSEALPFVWDGEAMKVEAKHQKAADERFVIGEKYIGTFVEDRSWRSHNHFFATVSDAWETLPERLAERFPSPDHLRKFCLIRAGFRKDDTFVCMNATEAARLASFLRPVDTMAVVTVRGNVVTRYTAESQSWKAMGKERFQQSKQAVLDEIGKILESKP